MRRLNTARHFPAAALLTLSGAAAQAALAVGAPAPDFSAEAAVGGQAFRFSLSEALKSGPVVVYFYPKSFTSGCTVEAHQFSEAVQAVLREMSEAQIRRLPVPGGRRRAGPRDQGL